MRITSLLVAGLLVLSPAAGAQSLTPQQRQEVVDTVRDALKRDPSILRDAIAAMQADDASRQQAQSAQTIEAKHAALFSDPADPVAGNPNGDVTIVEFYDARCPYCRLMLPVISALIASDPNVRVIYKDMPILGPASVLSARALLAAQAQGGYLRLQDQLMHGPRDPNEQTIAAAATDAGLDPAKLARDLANPAVQTRIDGNLALAQALQIQGTPALIVGRHMFAGMVELAELKQAVAAARSE